MNIIYILGLLIFLTGTHHESVGIFTGNGKLGPTIVDYVSGSGIRSPKLSIIGIHSEPALNYALNGCF